MNILKTESTTDLILDTLKQVSNTVGCTLGPKGKNVLINKNNEASITKDGVSVASNIHSDESNTAMVLEIIQKAASNTAVMAGDGTTTSIVLLNAIYSSLKNEGYLEVSKQVPIIMDKVIDTLATLRKSANTVTSKFIKQVALTSSNYDEAIATNVIEAVGASGSDGIILIEPEDTEMFKVVCEERYEFNGKVLNHLFFNKMDKVSYDDAFIFVSERKLTNTETLYKLLTLADGKPLVLACPRPDPNVLDAILLNRANKQVVWIEPQGYGHYRTEDLHDLSVMTGAQLITPETSFASITEDTLGRIKHIDVDMDITKLDLYEDNLAALEHHININKAELKRMTSEYNLDKKRLRLARLTRSVVRIIVGHPNKDVLKEFRDRIDDCIHAVKAALKHGYIRGGSNDLILSLKKLSAKHNFTDIELAYITALHEPYNKILSNAGYTNEEIQKIMEIALSTGKQFNPVTEEYEDFYKSNIVDPFYVTKCAIENATNVALLLLSTEYIVDSSDKI